MGWNPDRPLPETQEGLWEAILEAVQRLAAQSVLANMAGRGVDLYKMSTVILTSGAGRSAGASGGVTASAINRVTFEADTMMGDPIASTAADPNASMSVYNLNSFGLVNLYQNISVG